MSQLLSSDKPVQQAIEDRFQRFNFSKRIASTIIDRAATDCIVIGLFGAWGEGKTSVLNFIDAELSKSEDILIIKFNPWRFKDEETLLGDFFSLLANKLDKSLTSKAEKASGLLKKYAKLSAPMIKLIPVAGELISSTLEQVGEIISDDTIENIKNKIDKILIENNKKIVVIIDDIDRLNKEEIYSIFRLVKLTADFSNTTYILSFDEEMVASAIGGRFGEGNKESGKSFLEKIIQIPLNLPLAQPAALQQFCFEVVNSVLKAIRINLVENDGKRFSSQFQSNILLRLTTPRQAVRFGNALSFSIPLLFGEVDIDDLLLIEAMKVFYPKHYQFIKSNSSLLLVSYKHVAGGGLDKTKKELLDKHLTRLGEGMNSREVEAVKALLVNLFPLLNEVFYNHVYTSTTENNLYKTMSIASPKHFERYFSYTVIKGDLSNIAFRSFIEAIPNLTTEAISDAIKELILQSSAETLLITARNIEEDLRWDVGKKITEAITLIPEMFPQYKGFPFERFQEPYSQSQIFIYEIIKRHRVEEEQLVHIKDLIRRGVSFEYLYDLNNLFRTADKADQWIFTEEQLLELDYTLIERALNEAQNVSVFKKFPNHIAFLLDSWSKVSAEQLESYCKKLFEDNPPEVINLLEVYTPTGWSSLFPLPFKSDFAEDVYNAFINIFDKNFIKDQILQVYSIERIDETAVEWVDREKNTQTQLNIVRQFFYWFNKGDDAV